MLLLEVADILPKLIHNVVYSLNTRLVLVPNDNIIEVNDNYFYIGFLVGKEGPMIHSGAIVGAGLSQFRSWLFKSIKIPYPYFRSDRLVDNQPLAFMYNVYLEPGNTLYL